MADSKSKNLYQRIAAVMEEVEYVQKTGYNNFHKYSYAKEADYIKSLRPALLKHGLVVVPTNMSANRDPNNHELTTVLMSFTIINIDNPEERVTIPSAGQGCDKGDKGIYKAITGAKKYFIGTAFLIETGDDAEADEETDKSAATKSTPAAASSKAEPAKTEPAAAPVTSISAAPKTRATSFRKVGGSKPEATSEENPY
jgi:hypothetical protein